MNATFVNEVSMASKALFKIANSFIKSARTEEDFEEKPLGESTFEDFTPELKEEQEDIEAELDKLHAKEDEADDSWRRDMWRDINNARKERKEIKDKLLKSRRKAMRSNGSVCNVANLYIKAIKTDTSGAYFKDLEDIPTDDPELLEEIKREPAFEDVREHAEEEFEPGVSIEEPIAPSDDPGDFMPLLTPEEKASKLSLLKARHKKWMEEKAHPPIEKTDEERLLEMPLPEDEIPEPDEPTAENIARLEKAMQEGSFSFEDED